MIQVKNRTFGGIAASANNGIGCCMMRYSAVIGLGMVAQANTCI